MHSQRIFQAHLYKILKASTASQLMEFIHDPKVEEASSDPNGSIDNKVGEELEKEYQDINVYDAFTALVARIWHSGDDLNTYFMMLGFFATFDEAKNDYEKTHNKSYDRLKSYWKEFGKDEYQIEPQE